MRPRVVICGSFHRRPDLLHLLFKELEMTGCRVLSPLSLDFQTLHEPFVRATSETDATIKELESAHLRAIREADLIFLHAPEGYIGTSSSFELGYAEAIGKPIFSKTQPQDSMLKSRVQIVYSVFESLERLDSRT